MPRGKFLQNSFLAGEWSPLMQGRSDEEDYYRALNLSLNYIPVDEGALTRRSGSRFSAHAAAHDGLIRLVPFAPETDDAVVIEFTDLLARFHARGALVVDTAVAVVSISSATPAVVRTFTAHGLTTGDVIVFQGLGTLASSGLFNRQYTVTVIDADEFSIAHTAPLSGDVDGAALVAAVGEDLQIARVTERASPYAGADLALLKWAEEENTLYLYHPRYSPRTLTRSGLVIAAPDFEDGPYLDANTTSTTLSFSGTSGSVTVTASAPAGINDGQGFLATDVGRLIRVNTGTVASPAWSWMRITARSSASQVTATILGNNLASASATTSWRLGAFSDTTGWPTHGAIHEGRQFLVGPQPGRIYASRTFDFFDFAPTAADGTVADDNGVTRPFAGSGRQNGKALLPVETGLLVLTDGGEFLVQASSFDDPISPFSAQVRRFTDFGSADVQPVRAGRRSLFVQSLGRFLIEYGPTQFQGSRTSYDGNDVSRQGRHLTEEGLSELAYGKVPAPIVWALRNDGRVLGLTYRDDLEGRQVGWHRHSFEYAEDVARGEDVDGRYLRGGAARSTGLVYSIAVAPFSDFEATRNDNLWIAVKRGDVVCIEYVRPVYGQTDLPNEGQFVDSGNVYRQEDFGVTWDETAPGEYTFYGLDRLDGKTVTGTFRGAPLGEATVVDGAVTFSVAPELETAAAAYETTTITLFSSATANFVGDFKTDMFASPATVTDRTSFSPMAGALVGANGVNYHLLRQATSTIELVDIDRVAPLLTLSNATVQADLLADGVLFGGGNPSIQNAFVIPGTTYFVVPVVRASGATAYAGAAYYRVTAAGAIEYVGGVSFQGNGLTGFQFVFNAISAMGWWFGAETKEDGLPGGIGSSGDLRLDRPIVLAGFTEAADRIMFLPAVEYVRLNSPLNYNQTYTTRNLNLQTPFPTYANVLRADPPAAGLLDFPTSSRGFFLPGRAGRTLFFNYVRRDLMVAHGAATATNPSSLLTTLSGTSTQERMLKTTLLGFAGLTAFASSLTTGALADFGGPFDDVGEDVAGGAGADGDDYANPATIPTDPTNFMRPWLVVFPRLYAGDYESLGARTVLWDPETETATPVAFVKGQAFDATVEGVSLGVGAYNHGRSFAIGIVDDELLAFGLSANDGIVTGLGSFVSQTAATPVVAEQHIDAIIGCPYTSRAQLLRADAGSGATGPALGNLRRVDQFSVLCDRTGEISFGDGFDASRLNPQLLKPLNDASQGLDAIGRRKLFSGVFQATLSATYDFDSLISWEQSKPVPGTITAIAGFLSTSDR